MMEDKNFYIKNKSKFMKNFHKKSKYMAFVLEKRFSLLEVDSILAKSKEEYEKILPDIPYIGGFQNKLTNHLQNSAEVLAYIRVLERYHLTEKEIGEILYKFFKKLFHKKLWLIQSISKISFKNKLFRKILYKWVGNMNRFHHYEYSWHSEIIEPEGDEFIFGLNVLECGICKYYNREHAGKYIKYLCLADYPMVESFGLHLTRTKTIAITDDVCDCRVSVKGNNKSFWPPYDLKEWNAKKINPFDNYTEEYDQWFRKYPKTFKSELNALKKCFEKDQKSIEIGIGTGVFARELGIKIGVEPSDSMSSLARSRGLRMIKSYAEDLDVEDNSYQQTIMITVACFLNNVDQSFSEIYRILKEDGIFVIAFLNKDTRLGRIYDENRKNNKFYEHADFKSGDEIIELLQKNHFKVVDSYNTVTDFEDKEYDINKGIGDGIFTVIKAVKEKK